MTAVALDAGQASAAERSGGMTGPKSRQLVGPLPDRDMGGGPLPA